MITFNSNINIFNQGMFFFLVTFFLAINFQLVQCDIKVESPGSAISNGSSFKCYVCSNTEDSDCADEPASDKFIMDCDHYFISKSQTFNVTEKDYFCRKTIETGSTFAKDNQTVRIIRSCGNLRNHNRECYKTSDFAVKTETCECYEPLCNSADRLATISSTFFISILIPALSMNLF